MQTIIILVGIVVLLAIAVLASTNRKKIKLRIVGGAFLLQALIAAFIMFVPMGQAILEGIATGVASVMGYSNEGINFLFGDLGRFKVGFIFAFHVLPIIIFFSSLMSVLYYLGIMQRVVKYIGIAVQKLLGTSQAESTAAAANIFVGNTDVFIMMKPFAPNMTKSELFALMVGGFASVAGAVLVGYAGMGVDIKYLVAAAFMSAPAGLLFAKILYPETETPKEVELDIYKNEEKPINLIEAATSGAFTGLQLASAVGVMLLALISLIAMTNGILGGLSSLVGFDGLSLELIFSYIFAPFAFLLGVPSNEILVAGSFLGQKLVLNEFVAFLSFAELKEGLSEHTQVVITMALAGFANLSAPAAMIGVLGTIVPEKKKFIASMGTRVILGATLANLMSAALTGLYLSL
ncbi:NupC/NupG family nucleoside CNT transporter [Vibrio sp. Isolate34]|uniref:NupC/NupG family nucleoside CNT transporter n=1 Tax=Vibrio sp. Isolate34 TaxID=2908540 RepID=UPI001EFD006C|nr:NupC/NupG family nucleoside CNT transporter [Vibrio sp. Isolate34]MCG9638385.1 NupC/NupG family nucleoside CNT transporter [Vibrio sp. Isolate34]